MTAHASCIAGVPIFHALPPTAREALGQAMRHRRLEKDEILALAGDPITELVVVATGRLKAVRVSASGRQQIVRTLEPGELYGELALFSHARHENDLVALEPTEVCLLPRQAVQTLLEHHPDVAVRLIEALAERLAEAERLIADLGLRDVGQRLAAELLRAAERGTRDPGGIRVQMPVPWVQIADRLATTPESLSRRLRVLAAQGIIRQEGPRTVVILDPDRLRAVAEA